MADDSARAIFQSTLDSYGLGGLTARLWEQVIGGKPMEQVLVDLRQTPEYKARFPGIEELARKGRAIDEATYINIERSYTQVMRAAGIPQGFYDQPDDFGKLIASEVSPAELSSRVDMYTQAAYATPPETRAELQRLYGIGPGELTAFFIDADRALPILQQQFVASQTAGAAQRAGFGALTRNEAEQLAGLGVDQQQAEQGFGQLVDAAELFRPLDQGEDAIGREEQLGAAFGGNANARRRVEQRAARRRATFEAGGGYATSREGFAGLGEAR